ncbi:hypothetical protein ACFT55_09605, partial [Isoptericola sp. NPDC057191]
RSTAPGQQDENAPVPPVVPVGRISAPGADPVPAVPATSPPVPEAGDDVADDDLAGASVVDLGSRRAGLRTAAPERTTHPSGSARRPMPGVLGPQGDETPPETEDGAAHEDVVDDGTAPSTPPAPGPAGPQPAAPAPRNDKPAAARRSGRKGRAQVPSWDEIVFGGGRPSS